MHRSFQSKSSKGRETWGYGCRKMQVFAGTKFFYPLSYVSGTYTSDFTVQESNCKGLCLHQCKIPAQEFFQEKLGLPLTVSPNFVTQVV